MTRLSVTGGQVLRPDGTVERADVLVDSESGTITEVGPDIGDRSERVTGNSTNETSNVLDATNCLVTPGFVNGHCHVAMTLFRGYADDKPLETWLREDIWPAEAALTGEDVRAGAELGILEMIKGGTTAFADMYFFVPEIAAAVERAGVRARLGHGVISVGKDDTAAREDAQTGIEVARDLDGMADGRVTTAFMPHSLTTVDEAILEEFVPVARNYDVPIHYHANETEDEVMPIVEERGVRPLEYAADCGLLSDEDFIAHGVHLDEREIELLADTGTGVVHCPASNMKLASGMAPVQEMLDAGVSVGLGTDGAASNNDLSMLDEARDAAMIGKLAADDPRAVDATSVASLLTHGTADAVGLPGGRIEVGEPADLVVIDLEQPHLTPVHDPVSHLAYAASAADVCHTVCNGQVLMRDREVITLDEAAVRQRAREQTASLFERVHTE